MRSPTLYQLRMVTLNEREPLRDVRATRPNVAYFLTPNLKDEVVITRKLLALALDARFFNRYTDPAERMTSLFVFDVQLFLTPELKALDISLGRIISFCNSRLGVTQGSIVRIIDQIKRKVHYKVRKAMVEIANSTANHPSATQEAATGSGDTASAFSDELLNFFSASTGTPQRNAVSDGSIDEELTRWEGSAVDRTQTYVLKFWKDQAAENNFKYLPQVAKVYFSFPSSSTQIERDFGQCERVVTQHWNSLASHNVDMCSILSANREYVDLSQCDKLDKKERAAHIPPHILVGMLGDGEEELLNEIT